MEFSINPRLFNMRKILLFTSIFFLDLAVHSQSIFQLIEKNVGLIKYSFTDSNKIFTSSGTGTLIFKSLDGRKDFGYIFIVTNKHVLPKASQSKTIDFYISNIDTAAANPYTKLIIPIYQKDSVYDPHVKISSDEDIAIIEISRLMINTPLIKVPTIPVENFATKELLKNHVYNIGDVVFFIGYPNSFYSRDDYSPILRTGYISSNPLKKFYFSSLLKQVFARDSLDGFLIDANVFGGSSGSLIFTYPTLLDPEFFKAGHALMTNRKADAWILGVLTESYFTTGQNEYRQRINIGAVISSDKILQVINSYAYRDK